MFVICGVDEIAGTVALTGLDGGAVPRLVTGATVQEYSLRLVAISDYAIYSQ